MRSGPLSSLRVLELAGLGPGPLAATFLADLGADVVRIAAPNDPDPFEHPLARGRRTARVDLKGPAGLESLRDLVAHADALIDVYRPGVLERLGLGPELCLELNPRLVYVRVTGWGQDGPRSQQAGHDLNYISVTGVLHAIGSAEERPVPPLNLVGDYGGGTMFALTGLLAALHERSESGRGQVVDVAMAEGAASLALYQHRSVARGSWVDERGANSFDGGTPYYATYRCADDRYVAVGALEPRFFTALLDGLGLAGEYDQDARQWPAMKQRFDEVFGSRSRDEWTNVFRGTDACVTPVLSFAEASQDHHARARGSYVASVDDGLEPGPSPRFSRTPSSRPTQAGLTTAQEVLAAWVRG